jgi:hypothetical protein
LRMRLLATRVLETQVRSGQLRNCVFQGSDTNRRGKQPSMSRLGRRGLNMNPYRMSKMCNCPGFLDKFCSLSYRDCRFSNHCLSSKFHLNKSGCTPKFRGQGASPQRGRFGSLSTKLDYQSRFRTQSCTADINLCLDQ